MKADHVRSIRLNSLLKLYGNGVTDYDRLYTKCMTWGVTRQTAKSYLESLQALLQVRGKTIEY